MDQRHAAWGVSVRISRPITDLLIANKLFKWHESEFGWDEFNRPRIVLHGIDWQNQLEELWKRDEGICQMCGKQMEEGVGDPDHIVKRSDGADDQLSNLRLLCRDCHNKRHPEKQTRFQEVKISQGEDPC